MKENHQGVAFDRAVDGTQSTTRTGARIVAAALRPLNPEHANAALQECHWRRVYPRYFRQLVEGGLGSPELALSSASQGLDAAWSGLRWDDGDRQITLQQAMQKPRESFQTLSLKGQGAEAVEPWRVPLRGEMLSGDRLQRQLADWLLRGIIEPSAARALQRCIEHPEWFDLSDRTLVLQGAGSEAGPLRWLSRWRANLIAIDIDRPQTWSRIADIALAGNCTLHVPVRSAGHSAAGRDWCDSAGANLISQAPAIAQWLQSFNTPLDIGSFAYLDGERHVRVSMGMDMVVQACCASNTNTTLAYLATPTDVFAVPQATAESAMAAYQARDMASRTMQGTLRLATGERFFQPNVDGLVTSSNGVQYGIVDSMVLEQGPNYALAKRIQQWRALCARAAGIRVSLNIAPSTTTASVIKNPALAAGFAGASSFGLEVFEPETTNALMAALWVHDLRCDVSAANPARSLAHPFELFMDNACHGGLWPNAYLPRSALPMAAALGWVRQRLNRP